MTQLSNESLISHYHYIHSSSLVFFFPSKSNLLMALSHEVQSPDDNDDEHSFSYAMQLATSTLMSLSVQTATELGVFEVIHKAGADAELSATKIASEIGCQNPEAPAALDRLLRLLASHSVLRCSVVPDEECRGLRRFRQVYGLAPVARFYVPNADGASLGSFIKLIQDKVFLDSWLVLVLSYIYSPIYIFLGNFFNK